MKSLSSPALLVSLGLLLAGPPALGASATTHRVTDMAGFAADVPTPPKRIADLWYAHNEVVVMLGGAGSIAMSADRKSSTPWMYKVAPAMDHAIQLASPAPNTEALLAAGIDLVFASPGLSAVSAIRRSGIATVQMDFTDAASLVRCVGLTADALGSPEAHQRAAHYEAYLAERMHAVQARTDGLAPAARPRVLHIASLSPLKVDGTGTLIDQWIAIAGGRNAASGLSGNQKPVSLEQVAAWNPDIVILGGAAGPFDAAKADPLWLAVKAVRDGRVYRNPWGVYAWDRYSAEFALQLDWAAQTLHPALFPETDMVALTQRFYRDFFAYPLTSDEARRIIAAQPPV